MRPSGSAANQRTPTTSSATGAKAGSDAEGETEKKEKGASGGEGGGFSTPGSGGKEL